MECRSTIVGVSMRTAITDEHAALFSPAYQRDLTLVTGWRGHLLALDTYVGRLCRAVETWIVWSCYW